MEARDDDNILENYFFQLVLKKEMTKHALMEIYEVVTKEDDEIEDSLGRAIKDDSGEMHIDFSNSKGNLFSNVHLSPTISRYIFGKYEPLEGISDEDKIYIGKLFFGSEFPGIEQIDDYIDQNISGNVEAFRSAHLEKKGLVFHLIFSIIENLLNLKDEDFTHFLMNQGKETVELDLLYTIEKALKLFEANARHFLLSFRSLVEKLHSEDFLSDEELQEFKKEMMLLSEKMLEKFKNNPMIKEDIEKFEKMRENYKKMLQTK